MATTERRKSISLFFGFGKQEPKPDAMPDGYPKLRRKLQKVTKQTDGPEPAALAAPGVQTVRLPGDDHFLATKYDAARPPPGRAPAPAEAKPAREDKRSWRDSKPRFFSRSSSASRVPTSSAPRSASLTRVTAATALPGTATRPVSSWGETGEPHRGDAQKKTVQGAAQEAAPGAPQPRALPMTEEHERASAQRRLGQAQKTPPSASRTGRLTAPQQQEQAVPEPWAARPYPQFHRPYSQAQQQAPFSAAGSRPAGSALRKPAGLAPVSVSAMPVSGLSPAPSSAGSGSARWDSSRSDSSGSMHSPTAAGFNLSSASLALTAATSIDPSDSTPPMSARSVVGSFSRAPGRRKSTKFDFDNDSSDSSDNSDSSDSGSDRDGRRVVPELSYLSGSSAPSSPLSVSSADASSPAKPRRKVKTPVYAIGQLESGGGGDALHGKAAGVNKGDAADRAELAEFSLLQSKSSIECIAEEYRALLASRNSQTDDARSEAHVDAQPRGRSGASQAQAQAQRRFMLAPPSHAAADSPLLPAAVLQDWLPRTSLGIQSPPPPMPLPPLRTRSSMLGVAHAAGASTKQAKPRTAAPPAPAPAAQPDNLGLQICVDLLTRELSSAVVRRSSPAAATAASQRAAARRQLQQNRMAGAGTLPMSPMLSSSSPPASPADNASAALQILVMIEAYERLRDQLVADAHKTQTGRRTAGQDASTEEIEAMFGVWLKALYRIHDGLTETVCEDVDSDELDNTSDSDYEE